MWTCRVHYSYREWIWQGCHSVLCCSLQWSRWWSCYTCWLFALSLSTCHCRLSSPSLESFMRNVECFLTSTCHQQWWHCTQLLSSFILLICRLDWIIRIKLMAIICWLNLYKYMLTQLLKQRPLSNGGSILKRACINVRQNSTYHCSMGNGVMATGISEARTYKLR